MLHTNISDKLLLYEKYNIFQIICGYYKIFIKSKQL